MKKGKILMLSICALSLCMILGIFIGRNIQGEFHVLPTGDSAQSENHSASVRDEDYRLDINTATKVQLMELPGIGEVLADRIIAYRDENGGFSSVDALMEVNGLGEQKLREIESLIKVG